VWTAGGAPQGDSPVSSTVILVENLTKYYGRTRGVESIQLAVDGGEVFGFLGPNGAGKTTTIRLLLDLIRPTSGRVMIFGRAVREGSVEIRGRCGYLPGDFSAYGDLTGDEFIEFAARLRGRTRAVESRLLDRFGLSSKDLSRKIKHLSHGTRQKLGIVQAFFHEPELLVLDEPTIGLDPLMQGEFYRLLEETRAEGRTVFLSSHILPEVERVCDRVAIVKAGKLVALETLENLKSKRFRRLKLRLREDVGDVVLAGARPVKRDGLEMEFLFKGDADGLIAELARLPVDDFVFPEAELEEVFMTYYRED
jgi:ABC-2 type transport system ATP-binding protein